MKEKTPLMKFIPMLDQFPIGFHPYITNVVDTVADGHCGYHAIVGLLGMGEESWVVVHMNLYKEVTQFRTEYIDLFGGDDRFEYLKNSLLVDRLSMVGNKYS